MLTPSELNYSSDSDIIKIDRDDISNYNPEQVLPETPETIREIKNWLQPTLYNLDSGEYHKHLATHAAGTGDWLTSTDAYKEWLCGEKHGMLWIKGIPGSGKSVLAAKVIDQLSRSNPGVPVLFFFFRQIIDANHEPVGLLRDWLDQVLVYSPPLQKRLKEYLDSSRSLSSMSAEDLWKDLRLAFSGLPGKAFCVADALDKMDLGNEVFLDALAFLGRWRPGKVKLLVTSRPVPRVEVPLKRAKSLQIRLQETIVDVDIASYVRLGLEGSSVARSDQELIKGAVLGRANGLFLYAKLAMDSFLEPGADISKVMRALPDNLNDMYTRLLREHARRSGIPDDIQLLVLSWVTHATRPLRLLELAEMINVTYRTEEERNLETAKDLVRTMCGPLLEILPDETVSVVHHSLTEFLKGMTRSDAGKAYPILKRGSTNTRLGLACLAYMRFGALDHIKISDLKKIELASKETRYKWDSNGRPHEQKLSDEEVQTRLKFPFFEYAAANWHVHLSRSEATDHDQCDVKSSLDGFFENTKQLKAWLKVCWPGGKVASVGVTRLHVVANLGLSRYTKELLSSGDVEIDAKDLSGKTPLWWAASSGHADIVRLLTDAGANPDQEEGTYGLKPMHEAASKNKPEVITALLEAGVSPLTKKTCENPGRWCGNAPRSKGHTPLMYACSNGHAEAVDAFLPFIKDIQIVHRALRWAAESGQSRVVERILQHPGVDVNAKTRGDTPLYRASVARDAATIRLLIEAGADPCILCDSSGDEFAGIGVSYFRESDADEIDRRRGHTALHGLGEPRNYFHRGNMTPEEWRDIFTLMTNAGADVDARTPDGSTPLHMVVGNPVMVRLLLDAGADVNAATDRGETALHKTRNLDSMNLLIELGGGDINKPLLPSAGGRTPLLCLLDTYDTEIILKFLEYNPDCNLTDKHGNGALHVALKHHSTKPEIIRALLKSGADVNLKNHAGETPLLVAGDGGLMLSGAVECLLDAGADIDEADFAGGTLLFRAVKRHSTVFEANSHEDLKLLVEKGASTNKPDRKGRTLLHEAIKNHQGRSTHDRPRDGDVSRFDFLLGLGLDPQAADYGGNSLLHELARRTPDSYEEKHLVPLWQQLIGLGLDLDRPNHRGRTPLHILCTSVPRHTNSADFIPFSLVVSRVAKIDATDNDGITPLHLAATVSEINVKRLLEAGADSTASTLEGMTSLHLAARARQANIVGLLLESLKKRDRLMDGVNAKDDSGRTPLHYACRSGRPETVALLLEAGADVSIGSVFMACAEFEEEQELWDRTRHRADTEEEGDSGGLRLPDETRHAAAASGHRSPIRVDPARDTARLEEILDMLMTKGANLSHLDRWGRSDGGLGHVLSNRRDYSTSCFLELRARSCVKEAGKKASTRLNTQFAELAHRHNRENALQILREWADVSESGVSRQFVYERLLRREYAAVEELFKLGVDFLAFDGHENECILDVFIECGFTALLKKIGGLEVAKKFKDGTWHAAGDHTRPGLGVRTAKEPDADCASARPRTSFLLRAVRAAAPNMDVVRVLVEEFAVDLDELHITNEYTVSGYQAVPTDSALHSLARGSSWWHAALALPYLVGRGANLELRARDGRTPLHIALEAGWNDGPFRREAARALIAAGADVNATDETGKSCLGFAGADVEMVRLLVGRGAEVGADALLSAVEANLVDVLTALLSTGADPNMRMEKGRETGLRDKPTRRSRGHWFLEDEVSAHELYPLYLAATKGSKLCHPTEEERGEEREPAAQIVDMLLEYGADPFARFLRRIPGRTEEEQSERNSDDGGEDNGTIAADEIPEGQNAPTVPKGYEECSILHEVLIKGKLALPLLNHQGLDLNHRDPKGRTVLHAACRSRSGPDSLIGHPRGGGGDRSTESATPLSLLSHLLSLGADPLAVDFAGRNALHHIFSPHTGPATASLTQLARTHPILVAQRDATGSTPLHLALRHAASQYAPTTALAAASALLSAGADPAARDARGDTPAHLLAPLLARCSAARDLLTALLEHGADANARNDAGETPLFAFYGGGGLQGDGEGGEGVSFEKTAAAVRAWEEAGEETAAAVRAWEEAGADFFARDWAGRGLLHAAARGGVARFRGLLERGLDPGLEDGERQTALDVAAACRKNGILTLFKKGEII